MAEIIDFKSGERTETKPIPHKCGDVVVAERAGHQILVVLIGRKVIDDEVRFLAMMTGTEHLEIDESGEMGAMNGTVIRASEIVRNISTDLGL